MPFLATTSSQKELQKSSVVCRSGILGRWLRGNRAPFMCHAYVGGTLPQKPPKSDKFRTSRSGNWWSTVKQKPGSEKRTMVHVYPRLLPNHVSFTECIWVEGSQRSAVLCFPFSDLIGQNWPKNTSNCGVQAVRPISTNFFSHPTKDQRLQESEVGFEQPRTDHMISENRLPIPNQNIHDSRSAWMAVTYNVRRTSNIDFYQSYMIFPTM
jgi:hypothetical protein